jgi:hypothetical protein
MKFTSLSFVVFFLSLIGFQSTIAQTKPHPLGQFFVSVQTGVMLNRQNNFSESFGPFTQNYGLTFGLPFINNNFHVFGQYYKVNATGKNYIYQFKFTDTGTEMSKIRDGNVDLDLTSFHFGIQGYAFRNDISRVYVLLGLKYTNSKETTDNGDINSGNGINGVVAGLGFDYFFYKNFSICLDFTYTKTFEDLIVYGVNLSGIFINSGIKYYLPIPKNIKSKNRK